MNEVGNALIFRRKAYDDSALLLELFSESYGRISAVARGAQKSTSKLRSHLEPFRLVRVFIPHPRGRFIIGEAITIENFCSFSTESILYQSALILVCESYTPYHTQLSEIYRVMRRHLSLMKQISSQKIGISMLMAALLELASSVGMDVPEETKYSIIAIWKFLQWNAPVPLSDIPLVLDATPVISVV